MGLLRQDDLHRALTELKVSYLEQKHLLVVNRAIKSEVSKQSTNVKKLKTNTQTLRDSIIYKDATIKKLRAELTFIKKTRSISEALNASRKPGWKFMVEDYDSSNGKVRFTAAWDGTPVKLCRIGKNKCFTKTSIFSFGEHVGVLADVSG